MNETHISVMLEEAITQLQPKAGAWYIDATFGAGGHTAALLAAGAKVLSFDWDQEAVQMGTQRFSQEISAGQLILVHASFAQIEEQRQKHSIPLVAGVLFDFGTSSTQLTSNERGFSVHGDGPLDMRMDQRLGVSAADILAVVPEAQLADTFRDLGGEEEARSVARAIKKNLPITTSAQLVKIISQTKRKKSGHLHPATKVFQALRIVVNSELEAIKQALPQALNSLEPHGRIVTIGFHEGEDRIAKHTFVDWEQKGLGHSISKKPMTPSENELEINPRARSAKLRVFEKK